MVVMSKGECQHQGISLTVDGVVNLQLSAKSVGVFEAFYNSLKVPAHFSGWVRFADFISSFFFFFFWGGGGGGRGGGGVCVCGWILSVSLSFCHCQAVSAFLFIISCVCGWEGGEGYKYRHMTNVPLATLTNSKH